jgi:hypothetical protein
LISLISAESSFCPHPITKSDKDKAAASVRIANLPYQIDTGMIAARTATS